MTFRVKLAIMGCIVKSKPLPPYRGSKFTGGLQSFNISAVVFGCTLGMLWSGKIIHCLESVEKEGAYKTAKFEDTFDACEELF